MLFSESHPMLFIIIRKGRGARDCFKIVSIYILNGICCYILNTGPLNLWMYKDVSKIRQDAGQRIACGAEDISSRHKTHGMEAAWEDLKNCISSTTSAHNVNRRWIKQVGTNNTSYRYNTKWRALMHFLYAGREVNKPRWRYVTSISRRGLWWNMWIHHVIYCQNISVPSISQPLWRQWPLSHGYTPQ